MYHYRSTRRNDRSGHRSNSRPSGKRSTRARRFGGLLLAAAITLIATGMGTGQGLVLAVGLLFAPFGLHLFADHPAPPDRVHTIVPNHATHPGSAPVASMAGATHGVRDGHARRAARAPDASGGASDHDSPSRDGCRPLSGRAEPDALRPAQPAQR